MNAIARKTFHIFRWENTLPFTLITVLVITMIVNVSALTGRPTSKSVVDIPNAVFVSRATPEASQSASAPTELVISAPDQVYVGDLVEVDASSSQGESYKWQVVGVKDGNFRVIDAGTRVLIAADKAGEIVVHVAGVVAGKVDLKTRVIQVLKAGESVVDKAVEVADKVAETIKDKVKQAIDALKVERKSESQAALADSFETVAKMIDLGAIETPQDVVKYTKELNTKALGDDAAQWKPVMTLIEKHVGSLAKSGDLQTLPQHAKVWRDIAALIRE